LTFERRSGLLDARRRNASEESAEQALGRRQNEGLDEGGCVVRHQGRNERIPGRLRRGMQFAYRVGAEGL
jgi:hypothetical protein